MSRQRDYKTEYNRRLIRAALRGLSRSQARGHAKAGEQPIRSRRPASKAAPDPRLEIALKSLRKSGSQSGAAKEAGVSVERFRRFLRENRLAERRGGKWRITDHRHRQMLVITTGGERTLILPGLEPASLVGKHHAAVRQFLETNDRSFLEPFEAATVTDVQGRLHELETGPNRLHRLAAAGGESFEQIYRIVT